jgi:hypothetical protein
VIQQSDLDNAALGNAIVNGAKATGSTKTNSSIRGEASTTVDLGPQPEFEIVKKAGNTIDADDAGDFIDFNQDNILGNLGDKIKYTYEFKNTGNVTLSDVKGFDDNGIPGGPEQTLIFTPGTLAPGAVATASYEPFVTQAFLDRPSGSLTNTVRATAKTPAGTQLDFKTDVETVKVKATSDFTIVKKAGNTIDADDAGDFIDFNQDNILGNLGDKIKYTYEFKNTGNVTLSDVKGFDDNGIPGGPEQTLIFTPGTLAPGAVATASYEPFVTQAFLDRPSGSLTNTVRATARVPNSTVDLPFKTDVETVNVKAKPLIAVTKVANPTLINNPKVGDPIQYSYTLKNTGPVSLLNVNLVDNNGTPDLLTDDVTINAIGVFRNDVQIAGAPGLLLGLTDLDLDGALDDLAVGATTTATYTGNLTQAMIDAGSVTNIVIGKGIDARGTTVTDTANAIVKLTKPMLPPEICLVKTAGCIINNDCDPNASAGDTVIYTYAVTNSGPVDLFNLILMDDNGTTDFAGDDFKIDIQGLANLDGGRVANDLAIGQTVFGYYTKTLSADDICAGSFTNVGSVEGFSASGVSAKANDSATISFAPQSTWQDHGVCNPKPIDPCQPKNNHHDPCKSWGKKNHWTDNANTGCAPKPHHRPEPKTDCFGDRPTYSGGGKHGKPHQTLC